MEYIAHFLILYKQPCCITELGKESRCLIKKKFIMHQASMDFIETLDKDILETIMGLN